MISNPLFYLTKYHMDDLHVPQQPRFIVIVEEQRPQKIQHRSTPTTQKVLQQIQIAKYPHITYSTFGSTNCGVSDFLRCKFKD